MGFRGSSSSQASEYKLQGHTDEKAFCKLINGKVKVDSITGKTDVVGLDGKNYSVKGAKKKWQIFLYGFERFKNDLHFQESDGLGNLFIECLECFPKNYNDYLRDKNACLKILLDYTRLNPSEKALKDILELRKIISDNNIYFKSKLRLKKCTEQIKVRLKDKLTLRKFLEKSMFNNGEVDRIAIKKDGKFLIFNSQDVLNIFANNLMVANSAAGNRRTDLNIEGQKIIIKYAHNIGEIEIRNDSPDHYRQVRFNMNKDKTLELLLKFSSISHKDGDALIYYNQRHDKVG